MVYNTVGKKGQRVSLEKYTSFANVTARNDDLGITNAFMPNYNVS